MKVTKRIHDGYAEYENALKQGHKIMKCFGKYQYIYEDENLKISLVRLADIFNKSWFWEIAILTDDIDNGVDGDSIERFKTRARAEKRIKELFE